MTSEYDYYRSTLKALLLSVCDAPDSQIDESIVTRIKVLVDEKDLSVVASKLKALLDDCAHSSLASDFAMIIFTMVHDQVASAAGSQQ